MPETEELVINTGPLLALIAGIGDLSLLESLYKRVLVSFEVCQEIEDIGGSDPVKLLFLWLISSKIWPKMPLEHTF